MKSWEQRFRRFLRWETDSPDSCLIWIGGIRPADGLGRFMKDRREQRAHRVAFELFHPEVDIRNRRLVRECDNPQCVRHWRLDRIDRVLSDRQVQAIRKSRQPSPEAARKYGVTATYIRRIRCGLERTSGAD